MSGWKNLCKRAVAGFCACGCMGMVLPAGVSAEGGTTMDQSDAVWSRQQEVLSGYASEWTKPTYEGLITDRVPHTALLGNGDVGVASGGDEVSKNFYISKSDFWGYNNSPKAIGGVIVKAQKEAPAPAVSLAQGKKVTASSQHPQFPPARAVSGDYPQGYEGWVSAVGNPQWMEIDLEQATTFDRFVIHHNGATRSDGTTDTMAFSIAVRATASDEWTQVYSVTDNHESVSDITLKTPVTARYIRLDVTKGTQETTTDGRQNPRARIVQFEVFNTADTADTDEPTVKPTQKFYEQQDILNARILTDMELDGVPVHMETKMMANDNLLVTALTSQGDTPVDLVAQAWAKSDNASIPAIADVTAQRAAVTRTIRGANSNDKNSYNTQAALATQIVGADVTATASTASTADLAFTLPAGQTVYIVTAIGGGGRTYNYKNELQGTAPLDQAEELLDKAQTASALAALDADHAAWWKAYWSASFVQLDQQDERLATIQKYYYGAKYELGCSVREGKVAPGLYGIWHTTDSPSWRSDYHLNYNFIATFYGSAAANRPDQLLPAIEAITEFVEHGSADAATLRKFANEKGNDAVKAFVQSKIDSGDISATEGIPGGVLFPVGIGPWGMTLDTNYHNQTFNAPFSAVPLVQYYEYTQDEAFLENVLYEYLKPILTFLEAWVVKNENGTYDIYAGYNEGSWAKNSVGELSTYRMCLRYAIMANEKMGADADLRGKWQDLLDHLASYPVMEYQGKSVLAMAEDNYSDGQWAGQPQGPNRLTMEPIFPAGEFGYYSDETQLSLLRNTMQVLDDQNTWQGINCFPELYTQALMIRYDTDVVLDQFSSNIQRLLQQNLTIDDTVHGVEKAGATEVVHSMLLQADRGVVKAFPGWLSDKDASFSGLRAKGAFVLSADYDGARREVTKLEITSEAGQPLTIASPWADAQVLDETGKVIAATAGTAPNHPEERTYTFPTEVGKTYRLVKGPQAQQVDKTALRAQVDRADSGALADELFTPATRDAYRDAIAEAKAVLDAPDATQGQVDAAQRTLTQTFEKLTYLPQEIARFSDMEQTYTIHNTDAQKKLLYTDWKTLDGAAPVDLSGYDAQHLYLQLTMTLSKSGTTQSDGALFGGGMVKLRSLDDNGENNVGWSLGSRGLRTGQNTLAFCLADEPNSRTGTLNWSCVNRLNLYIDSLSSHNGDFSMTLANVAIVDTTLAQQKQQLLMLWGTAVDENTLPSAIAAVYREAHTAALQTLNNAKATSDEIEQATTTMQAALAQVDAATQLGDVDQNGRIDAVDALMTLQAAAQTITLDEPQQKAADVDESGTITSADALLILRYATGQTRCFS